MKLYYHSITDEIYIYLGKSTLPYFYRYQANTKTFLSIMISPQQMFYIGEL